LPNFLSLSLRAKSAVPFHGRQQDEIASIPARPSLSETNLRKDAMGFDPLLGEGYEHRGQEINAVCGTAADKPAFKDGMRMRRCLIPADGFYEWKVIGFKKKQLYPRVREGNGY
jgi:putative SOS response-associated peptidase YedK